MCLHDDFQGLGDKENMYGVGSVLPYKLREWMYRAMSISIKKLYAKEYLFNFSNFDLN